MIVAKSLCYFLPVWQAPLLKRLLDIRAALEHSTFFSNNEVNSMSIYSIISQCLVRKHSPVSHCVAKVCSIYPLLLLFLALFIHYFDYFLLYLAIISCSIYPLLLLFLALFIHYFCCFLLLFIHHFSDISYSIYPLLLLLFPQLIGSSLLFVYDSSGLTNINLIDFGKTTPLPPGVSITHDSEWVEGNHEDGYLLGLDNLIQLWQGL